MSYFRVLRRLTRTGDGRHIQRARPSGIQRQRGGFRMSEDFSSFAPDLWNALETIVQVRTYDARGVLFEQGHPADGVYMIQKGKVRVWMPERTPRMAVIDHAGAGTLLGLSET